MYRGQLLLYAKNEYYLKVSTSKFDPVCQVLEAVLMSELLRGLNQLFSSGWKKHYLPEKIICII